MNNSELNPFDANQRKLLAFGVVLILAVFLIVYFFSINKKIIEHKNNTVYLQNSKLFIFDDVYTLKQFPDKVLMHYPYLLIVQTDKPLTTIYNLETKQKEKEIKEVLLDYYQGNIVYNKKFSYFNTVNLDKYCDSAFIKNSDEVLCIAKSNGDSYNNQLYNIQTKIPNHSTRIYKSANILTTVSIINNDIYIGEIDFKTKQSFLTINNKSYPVDNIVNLVYPIKAKPYFASFKSELNDNTESYYSIENNRKVMYEDKIIFF